MGRISRHRLLEEVSAERGALGKPPIEEDGGPSGGGTVEKTVSATDPDCGMFAKGEHERQFAYEAHTACDKNGYVLGVEVTAGNIHDSIAWDALYDQVTARFPKAEYITTDAAYKTPWIMKKILDGGRIPIVPYTRYKGKKGVYKPWEFTYTPFTHVEEWFFDTQFKTSGLAGSLDFDTGYSLQSRR